MKTTLEINGIPATFEPETKTLFVNGYPVLPPRVVTVCAWSDAEKTLTKELQQAGFSVSHSITEAQRAKHFPSLNRPSP